MLKDWLNLMVSVFPIRLSPARSIREKLQDTLKPIISEEEFEAINFLPTDWVQKVYHDQLTYGPNFELILNFASRLKTWSEDLNSLAEFHQFLANFENRKYLNCLDDYDLERITSEAIWLPEAKWLNPIKEELIPKYSGSTYWKTKAYDEIFNMAHYAYLGILVRSYVTFSDSNSPSSNGFTFSKKEYLKFTALGRKFIGKLHPEDDEYEEFD